MSDARSWTPSDWREWPALQQPDYADEVAAAAAFAAIARAGPLVTPGECASLRTRCAAAARGEAFIVQAGDCAESLEADPVEAADCMSALIDRLAGTVRKPAVRIGRIAGQFAKPRSAEVQVRDGRSLPVYRGDSINGASFDAADRAHDPARLLAAYRHSAQSLDPLRRAGVYSSHEALVLPYEEALCLRDDDGRWWAGSGHMLWIGERTRPTGGAHVAFCAGIANVVGAKCGPSLGAEELLRLADRLDPERVPGKLLLIGRFGAERIVQCLPPLLRAARREGVAAGWMIDPMHGNTRRLHGRKQRRLADIEAELDAFLAICHGEGVEPAGIHLEISAGPVSECIDEDGRDPAADFPCDPRLNAGQAERLVARAAASLRAPAPA